MKENQRRSEKKSKVRGKNGREKVAHPLRGKEHSWGVH